MALTKRQITWSGTLGPIFHEVLLLNKLVYLPVLWVGIGSNADPDSGILQKISKILQLKKSYFLNEKVQYTYP